MTQLPSIVVTDHNHERLVGLVSAYRRNREAEALTDELDRARVVAATEIAPDVVTMNSRVRFQDEGTHQYHEVTLVYPHEAEASAERVSVLAPVGAALLGLAVGQVISWPLPSGAHRRLRIIDVTYQPEAAGKLT